MKTYTITARLSIRAIENDSTTTLDRFPPVTKPFASDATAKAAAKRLANLSGYPVEITCDGRFIALRTPARR